MSDKLMAPSTSAAPPRAPGWFVENSKIVGAFPEARDDGAEFFAHSTLGRVTANELHLWQCKMTAAQLVFMKMRQKPAWMSFFGWMLISGFALVGFIVLQVMEANADMFPEPWGKFVPLAITPLIPLLTKWFNEHRAEQAKNLLEQQALVALAIGPMTPPSQPVPPPALP